MPRDNLTREQIVRAAVELLDVEGIDGLSVRRLGARLGTAATAMYWHVSNKDELLVLAADEVWGEIALPDLDTVHWRAAAESMAHGLLGMVVAHPWLVTAMSTHLLYGPGKARYDDHLLGVFEAAGFTGADVDLAATALVTCTLGTALGVTADAAWRTRLRRAGADEQGEQDEVRAVLARIDTIIAPYPRLHARNHDSLEQLAAQPEFADGLAVVLDGLEKRLTGGA